MLCIHQPVWDDWILLSRSGSELLSEPDPRMPVYVFMNSLPAPVLSYHIATLLVYFFAGILFRNNLSSIFRFSPAELSFALLLFWILPLNTARVACINFPYGLSLLLFMGGLNLFLKSEKGIYHLLSVLMFLVSFMTPSLLVFYYGVWGLTGLYFYVHPELKPPKSKGVLMLFFCLPLFAWYIRNQYFQPEGMYAEYYALKPETLFQAPLLTLKIILKNFLECIDLLSKHPLGLSILPATILVGIAGIKGFGKNTLFEFLQPEEYSPERKKIYLITAGFLLLCAGIFPYAAILKEPSFQDWYSRHQLLMAPGIILIIMGICSCLSEKYQLFCKTGILCTCLYCCCFISRDWYKDQQKISALQTTLHQTIIPDSVNTIIIELPQNFRLASGRQLRFYEIGAWMQTPDKLYYTYPPEPPELNKNLLSKRYFLENYLPGKGDSLRLRIE